MRIAAEVLEVPLSTLSRDSSPRTVPAWDEIAMTGILDRLSETFRAECAPESRDSLHNLGDLIDLTDELIFGREI